MDKCPFCDYNIIAEREDIEHFQYGADEDAVMLSADVIVQYCCVCREQWTDWRSEDARQDEVEKHLATKGIYLCTACRSNPVDAMKGIDTCGRCLLSQGIT